MGCELKVLYTGSFNPFHNGHQYVYDVSCKCFGKDNVWIGIGKNRLKTSIDQNRIKYSIHPITRNVIAYDCLTAEIVTRNNFDLIVRGIRPGRSLDDENDLLYWNRKLSGGVETILIPTPPEVNQISSGAIREMDAYNQDVSDYMNDMVYGRWKNGMRRNVYFGRCCSGKTTYLNGFGAVQLDKVAWNYIKDGVSLKQKMKKAFYDKDYRTFNDLVSYVGERVNWYALYGQSICIDFPNVGTYWKYIPKDILYTCKLVKITASIEDRQFFAAQRKADPRLIETSDSFYIDPPFWDEEIPIIRNSFYENNYRAT
jgi:pantetheine-phosphate adenylyltransferase